MFNCGKRAILDCITGARAFLCATMVSAATPPVEHVAKMRLSPPLLLFSWFLIVFKPRGTPRPARADSQEDIPRGKSPPGRLPLHRPLALHVADSLNQMMADDTVSRHADAKMGRDPSFPP